MLLWLSSIVTNVGNITELVLLKAYSGATRFCNECHSSVIGLLVHSFVHLLMPLDIMICCLAGTVVLSN